MRRAAWLAATAALSGFLPAGAPLLLAAPSASAQTVEFPEARPAPVQPGKVENNLGVTDPKRVQALLDQAARLHREGRSADALKALDGGLRTNPRDARMRFLYGVIQNDMGQRDAALDTFTQLTQDYPELPEPYNNLAVMYAARGDLDQARAALQNAIRALPGYALAQENLGDVYVRLAMRAYERADKLDPKNSGPRNKLALARDLMAKVAPQQKNMSLPAAPARATSMPDAFPASVPSPGTPLSPYSTTTDR